ncbi:MAG: hypothetical protein R3F28_05235 [Candidatus Kapaibacterium sp.]
MNPITYLVTYDIEDDKEREIVQQYLIGNLGALRITECSYIIHVDCKPTVILDKIYSLAKLKESNRFLVVAIKEPYAGHISDFAVSRLNAHLNIR